MLGKRERVLDQFETGARVLRDNDLHDVETKENLGVIEHSQPAKAAARDTFLLLSIDRFDWSAEIFPRARFYFYKNQRVLIATNDIDLAAAAPFEVAVENLIAVTPQEPAGQLLPADAALEMLRPRRDLREQEAAAPPVRKIGDGLDKARIHGVSGDAAQCSSLCAD